MIPPTLYIIIIEYYTFVIIWKVTNTGQAVKGARELEKNLTTKDW